MREEEENMLEKLFHLKENKTTVKTEVTAGITSFFTMAYIIFVNPQILSAAGMDAGAVMLATCVASAIGTFLMTFLANYPFALAPGMGLNAFFAFTICGSMGYSWQAALAAVFISGCLFIIITVTGVRAAIDCGNFKPGYSWRRELATTKGYKIPTVPFYLWYMQSWISAELITGEEERR